MLISADEEMESHFASCFFRLTDGLIAEQVHHLIATWIRSTREVYTCEDTNSSSTGDRFSWCILRHNNKSKGHRVYSKAITLAAIIGMEDETFARLMCRGNKCQSILMVRHPELVFRPLAYGMFVTVLPNDAATETDLHASVVPHAMTRQTRRSWSKPKIAS